MSDSIIAVLGMGFLVGVVTTLTMIGVINVRDNKRQCTNDRDMRIYIPSRDRDRSSYKRNDKQMEYTQREMIAVLNELKKPGCKYEQDVVSSIIDIIRHQEKGS